MVMPTYNYYTCLYNKLVAVGLALLLNCHFTFLHKYFITVKSFVEMTRYLLTIDSSLFLLSERVSQDPLEHYFGKQRGCGGRNENPTLDQCIKNAPALRMQKSFVLNPVRGNCRRKRFLTEIQEVDDTPLPKRKKT